MKIAVSISDDGSVSPLFDVSRRIWLGERSPLESACEPSALLEVAASDGESKIKLLASEEVELLLCGAISRCLEAYARSYGIEVEPFLCGQMEEILDELAKGQGIKSGHRMPGCLGRQGLTPGCRRKAGLCAGRKNQNKKES